MRASRGACLLTRPSLKFWQKSVYSIKKCLFWGWRLRDSIRGCKHSSSRATLLCRCSSWAGAAVAASAGALCEHTLRLPCLRLILNTPPHSECIPAADATTLAGGYGALAPSPPASKMSAPTARSAPFRKFCTFPPRRKCSFCLAPFPPRLWTSKPKRCAILRSGEPTPLISTNRSCIPLYTKRPVWVILVSIIPVDRYTLSTSQADRGRDLGDHFPHVA